MCVVSSIGDAWSRRVPTAWPWTTASPATPPTVTPREIEALRSEITELRKLLLAAKAFDAATGQPDCETDDKVALIKRLAELVGVDVSDVFADTEADS